MGSAAISDEEISGGVQDRSRGRGLLLAKGHLRLIAYLRRAHQLWFALL